MPYQVKAEPFESAPILVLRRVVPRADLVPTLLSAMGEVWNRVKAEGIQGAGRNIAVYRGAPNGDIDLEAGVELLDGHNLPDSEVRWTPAGDCAHVTHVGDYALMAAAHEAIQDWCRKNQARQAGPSWEIYGHWTEDPSRLTTDIYYLLEKS